jgi:(aminoalkyl)phosphonate N-acetyltransferase
MINSKIKIRRVEMTDLRAVYDALCNLENEAFDFEIFTAIFIANISNPNYAYYIAENGTTFLGFISFHTQQLLHHCDNVGEIQEFYVAESFRNKGIGKQLINKVFEYADQNKLKSIEVTTNKKRMENTIIYENLGFTLTHNKFTIGK